MMHVPIKFLALPVLMLGLITPVQAATSALWGTNGELWRATSRLPDFSFAGYHCPYQLSRTA
jgi:hypothetical protein